VTAVKQILAEIGPKYSDRWWRINNLYWIRNEKGERVKFQAWPEQERLYREMHYLNIVLKARQLGMTTFLQIFMLDACLFNSNTAAATIAHRLDDAKEIFNNKVRYAYENLPEILRGLIKAEEDSARKLSFSNGSSILVDTMLRSGTYQYLHVSEHGKLCARYPEKARELRTGALNTVHAGQFVFIESTAEGQEGDFFEFCERARNLVRQDKPLTKLDFKFFFFPWWTDTKYRLEDEIPIPADQAEYFEELSLKHSIKLDREQQAWYIKKLETQREDMKREFPSTPDEAFEAAIEGAYYGRQMALLRERGQICRVPHQPGAAVNTFWDVGRNDNTAIWFHQRVGREHHLIDYYEHSGEGFAHYARILKERASDKGYVYGTHYLPHDMGHHSMETDSKRRDTLEELGVRPTEVVPKTSDVNDDIEQVRNWLPTCWMDEENCAKGIKCLDHYRKEWDDDRGVFRNKPRHDWASHGADSLRTGAMGWEPQPERKKRDRYDHSRYNRKSSTTWMSA